MILVAFISVGLTCFLAKCIIDDMRESATGEMPRISDRGMRAIRRRAQSDVLLYKPSKEAFEQNGSVDLGRMGAERRILIRTVTTGLSADNLRGKPSTKREVLALWLDGVGAGWERGGHCPGMNPKIREYQSFDALWGDLVGR